MMNKVNPQGFVLWGGFIVVSAVLSVFGFYVSNILGAVLLGVCVGVAFLLALGKKVAWLDRFEAEFPEMAKGFSLLGKLDVLFSILVLPWLARAFFISMGWQWKFDNVGERYIMLVAYLMCVLWGMVLAIFVGRLVQNKFFRH